MKMDTVDLQLQSVPELTQKLNDKTVEIDNLFKKTDSLLIEKTEQIQANETKVNDLFEKTEQFYEKTRVSFEKVIDDLETTKGGILGETLQLKKEIVTWSDEYAGKIEAMVKGGDYKYERGTSTQKPKFDKKDVSVWQIPVGVSKPDFRHWADNVDLQLEAVHNFVFPDLVLEKVKRIKGVSATTW